MKNIKYAIAQSNLIEREQPVCDIGSNKAFQLIMNNDITERILHKAHFMLLEHKGYRSDQIGQYRNVNVTIGNDRPPYPLLVPSLMQEYLETLRYPVKNASDLVKRHIHFETIHPFIDGNGRIGRLLLFKDMMRFYGKIYPIPQSVVKHYYNLFKYKSNNDTLEARSVYRDFLALLQKKEFRRTYKTTCEVFGKAFKLHKNNTGKTNLKLMKEVSSPFQPYEISDMPEWIKDSVYKKLIIKLEK